ncbi:ABC transporter substrate-binding protein [Dokdonia sp. Hel_I_53]|uniref:ABC transporter substrate-binding protein n=1 Tax=Dokdonia sp. Hel_I_53 TaxID=1566287 RepID=UPI00119BE79A|nr:ABC transporter substrate-binding protein [Dokdonia sp. Hel_I_53]TVZ51025.1 iron complex transport system substrate-binding protein [Dokdonia sp. Hel_I_53]
MKKMVLAPVILLLINLQLLSCKQQSEPIKETSSTVESVQLENAVTYAEGFNITSYKDYTILDITKAFPGSDKVYSYALLNDSNNTQLADSLKNSNRIDQTLITPIQSIIVTSTTHIPSLETLGVAQTLVGFPGLDYISSPLSRKRIDQNLIKEVGYNESLNTELVIELSPDVVVSFGVEGENKTLNTLQNAKIPVIYNGDWVETHPLGKAEWIKFFGALYNKAHEADSIFKRIERNYLSTKEKAKKIVDKPTVLSGAMYKDVWYVPNGESWQAKIIDDAGGNYLWSQTAGTGSITMSVEAVLDEGQDAAFWIAPAQYTSYSKLLSDNKVYGEFDSFKNKRIYTFAKQKGIKGGVLYYELAPNRPDLVLEDLVSILHPEQMPKSSIFFTPLDE